MLESYEKYPGAKPSDSWGGWTWDIPSELWGVGVKAGWSEMSSEAKGRGLHQVNYKGAKVVVGKSPPRRCLSLGVSTASNHLGLSPGSSICEHTFLSPEIFTSPSPCVTLVKRLNLPDPQFSCP